MSSHSYTVFATKCVEDGQLVTLRISAVSPFPVKRLLVKTQVSPVTAPTAEDLALNVKNVWELFCPELGQVLCHAFANNSTSQEFEFAVARDWRQPLTLQLMNPSVNSQECLHYAAIQILYIGVSFTFYSH